MLSVCMCAHNYVNCAFACNKFGFHIFTFSNIHVVSFVVQVYFIEKNIAHQCIQVISTRKTSNLDLSTHNKNSHIPVICTRHKPYLSRCDPGCSLSLSNDIKSWVAHHSTYIVTQINRCWLEMIVCCSSEHGENGDHGENEHRSLSRQWHMSNMLSVCMCAHNYVNCAFALVGVPVGKPVQVAEENTVWQCRHGGEDRWGSSWPRAYWQGRIR
jgi:hypothetical protein